MMGNSKRSAHRHWGSLTSGASCLGLDRRFSPVLFLAGDLRMAEEWQGQKKWVTAEQSLLLINVTRI